MNPEEVNQGIIQQLAAQASLNGTAIRLDLLYQIHQSAAHWVVEYTKALKPQVQFSVVDGPNATAIVLQDFAAGVTRTFSELLLSATVGLHQAQFSLWRAIADVTRDASYVQAVRERENTHEVAVKLYYARLIDRAKLSPDDKERQEEARRVRDLYNNPIGPSWWAVFNDRKNMTSERERGKYVQKHEREQRRNDKPALADFNEAAQQVDQIRQVANQVIHAANYWSIAKLCPEKVETEPMLIHASACLTRTISAFRLATSEQIPYREAKTAHQAMEQYQCPAEDALVQAWNRYWTFHTAYQQHISNRA